MPDIEKYDKVEIKIIEDELWFYYVRQKYKHKPNIYEFAHRCKEWAFENNFILYSMTDVRCRCKALYIKDDFRQVKDIYCETEQEAIIKMCLWLLRYKKRA